MLLYLTCRPQRLAKTCLLSAVLLTVLSLVWFWLPPDSSLHDAQHADTRPKLSLLSSQRLTRDQLTATMDREHREPGVRCVPSVLNPYDPAIMQYHKPLPAVNCGAAMEDWVYVINGTFHISRDAIRRYGDITCEYASVERNGDFSVRYASPVKPMLDGMPLLSDFFRVACKSANGQHYTNIHAAVAWNRTIINRLQRYHSSGKSSDSLTKGKITSLSSSPSRTRHSIDADSMPQTFNGLNLSVFMFSFDSISRMARRRLLPKSLAYFTDQLGAIELEAYNIVGDGTPAALLPILTGKMEEELPEARRGFRGARPVDDHPWIWKEFSQHGYVTAYAEDATNIGAFHYRMLGFDNQPTDHFMRPFYLAAQQAHLTNPPLCWGSVPHHMNYMNWFASLFDMYRDFPKIFFAFYSSMSHDDNNRIHALDDDLVTFLKELETKGHLNSTLLILMDDHGARYDFIRATSQGRLEERLPYFSFRFPPWVHHQYPHIIRNMLINTKRLTTPFDIHATLQDILHYSATSKGDGRNRGISLFKEIPKERTCTDAEVTPHWCACLLWQPVNVSDPLVSQAVATAIGTINGYTQSHRKKCAKLTLLNVTQSLRYTPSPEDRSAELKLMKYANKRLSSFPLIELYQVSFKTLPGQAHFEVTCKLDVQSGKFSVGNNQISRIDKYGSQPACIQKGLPHLRPYCYCLE